METLPGWQQLPKAPLHFLESNQQALSPLPLLPGADEAAVAQHHGQGGAGAVDLANAVIRTCQKPADFKFTYPLDLSLKVGWLTSR